MCGYCKPTGFVLFIQIIQNPSTMETTEQTRNSMRNSYFVLIILALACILVLVNRHSRARQEEAPLPPAQEEVRYTVQEIWGGETYNAFTSLIKFKDRFYCAFREGMGHVFDEEGRAEGKIRVLRSQDGHSWESVYFVGLEGKDFRDPKLSITPDGRLCLSIGVSVYVDRKLVDWGPYVCFSQDGAHYTAPQACTLEGCETHSGDWIWRTTWHQDLGYSVNYWAGAQGQRGLTLMKTADGLTYSPVAELQVPDFPNEATIRFLSDGRMAVMVRRDGGNCRGYWAVSEPPYTAWEWKEMPMQLGGPDFLLLSDEKVVAASRSHYLAGDPMTSIFTGDVATGRFRQRLVLPSGGDTSYCGLLIEGDELWISYYSAHKSRRPKIYLARLPLKCLE